MFLADNCFLRNFSACLNIQSPKRTLGSQDSAPVEVGVWGAGREIKEYVTTTNKNISKTALNEGLDLWILNGIFFNVL